MSPVALVPERDPSRPLSPSQLSSATTMLERRVQVQALGLRLIVMGGCWKRYRMRCGGRGENSVLVSSKVGGNWRIPQYHTVLVNRRYLVSLLSSSRIRLAMIFWTSVRPVRSWISLWLVNGFFSLALIMVHIDFFPIPGSSSSECILGVTGCELLKKSTKRFSCFFTSPSISGTTSAFAFAVSWS